MNKREKKQLEARKSELISELQFRQTALALTNGLADEEFSQDMKNELDELNSILRKLGLGGVKIEQSHKIHTIEIP